MFFKTIRIKNRRSSRLLSVLNLVFHKNLISLLRWMQGWMYDFNNFLVKLTYIIEESSTTYFFLSIFDGSLEVYKDVKAMF